jgi:hypothetical protein
MLLTSGMDAYMGNIPKKEICNKRRFPDEFSAHYMMSKLIRSKKYTPQRGKILGVYFCGECMAYHFGHSFMKRLPKDEPS